MFESVPAPRGARAAALLVAAAVALAPSPSSAQSEPERGGARDRKEALRRLEQGDRKLQRGDRLAERGRIEQAYGQFEAALADYQAAYQAYPDPQILYPIAQAEQRLGRFVDALQHYQELLAESKALSANLRSQVQLHLNEVRKNLAAVVLEIDPPGATIEIDGKPAGRSPTSQPIFVEPGQHTYRVSRDGYRPVEGQLDLVPGKELRRRVRLERAQVTPAKVVRRRPTPAPVEPERPSAVPVWVGIGLTGALAISGTVTGLAAVSKHNKYEDESRGEQAREQARADGKRFATATDILLGGALVVGGVTAYYYFASYRPRAAAADSVDARGAEREEAMRVEPLVGPDVAGLAVSGTFW
jgi:tetratricopeptide (TPR) repeat protein